MKKVLLYTDGACSFNPGPGGWGAVLIYGTVEKRISGFQNNTTNNRMEIMAVIMGLKALKEPCSVDIYTDSAYVYNAFKERWIENWIKNNWKNSNKKEILNQDLWLVLKDLVDIHDAQFHKVLGHSTNKYNNLCDSLARNEVKKYLDSINVD